MEQMIQSKNNRQTKNRNRSWPRRADLGFLGGVGGGRGGSRMDGHFGNLGDANYYIWRGLVMGSYCTAQVNGLFVVRQNLMKHCKSTIIIIK